MTSPKNATGPLIWRMITSSSTLQHRIPASGRPIATTTNVSRPISKSAAKVNEPSTEHVEQSAAFRGVRRQAPGNSPEQVRHRSQNDPRPSPILRHIGRRHKNVEGSGNVDVIGKLVQPIPQNRAKSYSGSPRSITGSTTSHGARTLAKTCWQCTSPSTAVSRSDSAARSTAIRIATSSCRREVGLSTADHSASKLSTWWAAMSAVEAMSASPTGTAIVRTSAAMTGTATDIGSDCRVRALSNRSNSIARVCGSTSNSRTTPRPAHSLSPCDSRSTSSPGGASRRTNRSPRRRTGTTSAFDPCIGGPSGSRSHRAHCAATSAGISSSHARPASSCHHRGISRKASGTTTSSPNDSRTLPVNQSARRGSGDVPAPVAHSRGLRHHRQS